MSVRNRWSVEKRGRCAGSFWLVNGEGSAGWMYCCIHMIMEKSLDRSILSNEKVYISFLAVDENSHSINGKKCHHICHFAAASLGMPSEHQIFDLWLTLWCLVCSQSWTHMFRSSAACVRSVKKLMTAPSANRKNHSGCLMASDDLCKHFQVVVFFFYLSSCSESLMRDVNAE